MESLNYSSYVHKMEVGLRRNGMHPMAVLLLTSITKYKLCEVALCEMNEERLRIVAENIRLQRPILLWRKR